MKTENILDYDEDYTKEENDSYEEGYEDGYHHALRHQKIMLLITVLFFIYLTWLITVTF
jgi:multidrug efflux pump subunit AcrB